MRAEQIRGRNAVAWGALALALAGLSCGPVYKTAYRYEPPDSALGKTCSQQCETIKLQCETLEDERYDTCRRRSAESTNDCEQEAERDYDRCVRRGGEGCSRRSCVEPDCARTYDHCIDRYNDCYRMCGGTVTGETVCVSNCSDTARQLAR